MRKEMCAVINPRHLTHTLHQLTSAPLSHPPTSLEPLSHLEPPLLPEPPPLNSRLIAHRTPRAVFCCLVAHYCWVAL